MSLENILKTLQSGQIGSIPNLLLMLVHSALERFVYIDTQIDLHVAGLQEQIRRLEDRLDAKIDAESALSRKSIDTLAQAVEALTQNAAATPPPAEN